MDKDAYSRIARVYDTLFQGMTGRLARLGIKMLPPEDGATVLDVGCGTGTALSHFRDAGCAVWGIDSSGAMLAVARKKLGDAATLHLRDATQMPFADGMFDMVTMSLVLHEMPHHVRSGTLDEIKRVLKHDGHVLFTDYTTGPFTVPRGWAAKLVISIAEVAAGRAHFGGYRDFLRRGALPTVVTDHGFEVVASRAINGGTMLIMAARPGGGSRDNQPQK